MVQFQQILKSFTEMYTECTFGERKHEAKLAVSILHWFSLSPVDSIIKLTQININVNLNIFVKFTLVNIVPSLSPVSYWWNTMVTASLSSAVISSTAARPFRFPSFFVFFFSNELLFVVGGGGPGDWVPPVPLSSCPTVLIPHIS